MSELLKTVRVNAILFLKNYFYSGKVRQFFVILRNDVEKVKKSGPRRHVCIHFPQNLSSECERGQPVVDPDDAFVCRNTSVSRRHVPYLCRLTGRIADPGSAIK
jgi:hypothetical protein